MALRRCLVVGVSVVLAFMVALTPPASAAAGSRCDEPPFSDVASRTLQSTVVFQGHVTHTAASEQRRTSPGTINVVEFSVTRVLKMSSRSSSATELRTMSVIADCSLDVEVGVAYVVFAAAEELSSGTTSSRWLHRVLGQPIQSSRRVVRQVLEYACDECDGL